jgi:hypothetical protein
VWRRHQETGALPRARNKFDGLTSSLEDLSDKLTRSVI